MALGSAIVVACSLLGSGAASATGGAVVQPSDVTLYVAEPQTSQTWLVGPDGGLSSTLSGLHAYGIAVDASRDVFVTDDPGGRVVKQAPDGTQTVVATGLDAPAGLALDPDGDLFVSGGAPASPYVVEIAPGGERTLLPFSGLKNPLGVAVDARGDVFVADGGRGAVLKLTPAGVESAVGDGFGLPSGVAVDRDGDVLVADQQDCEAITRVTPDGHSTRIPVAASYCPVGVAVDSGGDVYVSSHTQGIYAVSLSGARTTMATSISGFALAVYEWTPQRISFTSYPHRPRVGKTFQLAATGGGSGQAVRFSTSAASRGCTVTLDGRVTATHVQRCVVEADQAAAGPYAAAPTQTLRLEISPGAQHVQFTSRPPRHPRVGEDYRPTATGGSTGHPVRFLVRGSCVLHGRVITFTHARQCVVVAHQAGARDWLDGYAKQSIGAIGRA